MTLSRPRIAQWTLLATRTPLVHRRCPRCDALRAFRSSDRFRVNAQQHRLDVWLIYRCASCDFTWNHEVAARTTAAELGPERHLRYLANDSGEAWRAAFDVPALRATGAAVDLALPYRTLRPSPEALGPELELAVPWPLAERLDRFLARELGLSRAALAEEVRRGALVITGGDLRRPVRDGTRILRRGPGGP